MQVRKPPAPEWYEVWFNSPYYHLLYHYRDKVEAEGFIDRFLDQLHPVPGARILDLACGRGRYSRYLAEKGFDVVGIDLSERNIQFARQFEKEKLSFFTHDMRRPFRSNFFDYIFNFFTSFGYFNAEKEDLRTLKNSALGLRPNGMLVLDYFNSQLVIRQPGGKETNTVSGIAFHTEKYFSNGYVYKNIQFEDQGQEYQFQERVRLYVYEDFVRLFQTAGLKIIQLYGDYLLRPFAADKSPRLILVAKKI